MKYELYIVARNENELIEKIREFFKYKKLQYCITKKNCVYATKLNSKRKQEKIKNYVENCIRTNKKIMTLDQISDECNVTPLTVRKHIVNIIKELKQKYSMKEINSVLQIKFKKLKYKKELLEKIN